LLAACATTPLPNEQLIQARASYERAAYDPVVARTAPADLQKAQQAIYEAEQAQKAGKPKEQVDHLAYLAHQRSEAALQAGAAARSEQAVADSRTERDRIVIDARTREASNERAKAEQAQGQADAARQAALQQQAAAEAARRQALATQAYAGSLQAQIDQLNARPTDRGMVLTLGDVLFDTGHAELKPGATRTLDKVATFLGKNPQRKVRIEGYTDSTGSEEYNRELSERRADAVRDALAARGIGSDRIEATGLGERYAVASNDTAAGRQQNRRVELVFSNDTGEFRTMRN
jgi:outer membrane protein OmpA-like peptidoglycan-associated protein